MSDSLSDYLSTTIDEYIECARHSFRARIDAWNVDIFEKEVNEVVGGLLARQVSLATTVAKSPWVWNVHVLPVVLRCMADVYITFCWILKDPKARSRQFIEYGLGQEKLAIEKYREVLSEEGDPDPDAVEFIESREKVLDAERYRFLIPVNLGSWSEISTRDMAIEVGEKRFYDLVFAQFSAAVHSTWQHIWRLNLFPCSNPLHMGHRVPHDPDLSPDPELFTNAAKYLCKTFAKFDAAILAIVPEGDAYESYNLVWDRFAEYFDRREGNDKKTDGAPAGRRRKNANARKSSPRRKKAAGKSARSKKR